MELLKILDLLNTKYSGEQKTHMHMQNKVLTNTTTHFGAVFSCTHTLHSYLLSRTDLFGLTSTAILKLYSRWPFIKKKNKQKTKQNQTNKPPFTRQLRLSYKITALGPNVPKAALMFFSP